MMKSVITKKTVQNTQNFVADGLHIKKMYCIMNTSNKCVITQKLCEV